MALILKSVEELVHCNGSGKQEYKTKIVWRNVIQFALLHLTMLFYNPLVLYFCFYLPTMIPIWCWGETVWNSFFIAFMARYGVSMNCAAHKYGDQPFDKYIEARENPVVALLTTGEGWHNYHHVFPWDYATSELGYTFNLTKVLIDVMAMIGLAYDLKTANSKCNQGQKTEFWRWYES